MKKVLVLGMTNTMGGVESFLINYTLNTQDQDICFEYMIFGEHCAYEKQLIENNRKIIRVKNRQFKEYFAFKREMTDIFKKGSYDVIWMNCCDLANAGILNIAKECGIKRRIIHAHNSQLMFTGKKAKFYSFMHTMNKKHIARFATDYWACSKEAARFFYPTEIFNQNLYFIINNAIDVDQYQYREKVDQQLRDELGLNEKIVIGHIGRFQYQKNHDFLLDIFRELHERNNRYFLIMIGEGEERERVKQRIVQQNLESCTRIIDSTNEVYKYYSMMNFFLLPSRFEGLPMVLMEAQASGLKCFTSNTVVSQKANVTGNIEYINLEEGAKAWAERIDCEKPKYDRTTGYQIMQSSLYNLKNQKKKVIELLVNENKK